MRAQVKKDGVLIPKKLLKGVKQVEIRKEAGRIVLLPVPAAGDPIFRLGKRPVKTGAADASVQHDRYLYGGK
jgi:virulence-associated protein VagC